MATETAVQVIPSSADVPGMSVVTASRHQDAPRSGLIYNPATLAAAVPIWFHPMPDGRYLALFSRRLTDAALSPNAINGVLLYTGYSVSDDPCWATVGPQTGDLHAVNLIPSEQPGIRRLVGAASRGQYLFTLNSYKKSEDADETLSLLQNFRVSPQGIILLGEELVPRNFRLGLYCDRRYLWVFGDDGDGKLAMARKNWGRIGTNSDANPTMSWQYYGKGRWNADPEMLSALMDSDGQTINADGPCSMARYRDTYYLMASLKSATTTTKPSGEARLTPVVNADGTRLYVADYTGNKVYVVNTETGKTIATMSLKNGPWTMTFNPDGTKLYVANKLSSTISVIDPAQKKIIAEIGVNKASGAMVFNPNGTRLYLINSVDNIVLVINTETNQLVETITVGTKPYGATVNAAGTRLYVTNSQGSTVSVINLTTGKVIKNASVGSRNSPTVSAASGSHLFIGGTDSMLVFNTSLNRVVNIFPVLNIGLNMVSHPDDPVLYLANTTDSVTVIGGDTYEVTDTIAVGTDLGSVQVAISGDGSKLYATNTSDNSVSIIDTATNTVTGIVMLDQNSNSAVTENMDSLLSQLSALLGGVLNGFIGVSTGVITMIADLLDQATTLITGQPGTVSDPVKVLVGNFLKSITGIQSGLPDPASILEDIIRGITNIPGVGQAVTLAEDFISGVINSILDLTETVVGPTPVQLLEDIIRMITGISVGTGNDGGAPADVITIGTTQVGLTTEPSWTGTVFSNRRVDQTWNKHGFTHPIATTTTTYQDSGAYLQEQIPLTPGYGVTTTRAEASYLNTASDHVQVYTGTTPHTVILPPTAKLVGTTTTTEGAILVPDSPQNFYPKIAIDDATITEGNFNFKPNVVKFRLTLSSSSSSAITVRYTTANDTAVGGSDFTAASGTVTFQPGIVSQQITATVTGDFDYEQNEAFTVELSEPTNATIDDGTAVCTIVNDDARTLIEALIDNFKTIVTGISSGAIKVGSSIATAVTTILEQSVRTLTGVVGDTGQLVLGLVDDFLNFISGGMVNLPGQYGSPAEMLASILDRITGGTGTVASSVLDVATEFYNATFGTITNISTGVVSVFQKLVSTIFNPFGTFAATPMLMSASATTLSSTASTEPVSYMPYTIHNQSTSDIVVMASERDKTITVPKGTGMTFTPYASEPTKYKDWSWVSATERAPRARQGYPFVSTNRLNVNTYLIDITGAPDSGVFRLAHDGHVSEKVNITTSAATNEDNIRVAIASLGSVNIFSVTSISLSQYEVVITEDCSTLAVYSYRLFNGTSPKVEVTLDNSDSTLLTRWGIFQPEPKAAAPAAQLAPTTTTTTEVPEGLPGVLGQFAKVITVVSEGTLAVGAGVILTVTDLIGNAVLLLTGAKIVDTTAAREQVADFLKKLAANDGITDDAATAFENILRQITGGTAPTTNVTDLPTPMDFISGAVNAVDDVLQTLAEILQKIINAIVGK